LIINTNKIQKVVFLSYFHVDDDVIEMNRIKAKNSLKTKLEENGYMVLNHDEFKSYEFIPKLIAMADVMVCFWDKYYTSSTWKMIEIEEGLKTINRTIDPIGRRGKRPTPIIIIRIDDYQKIDFNESYDSQIFWTEPNFDIVIGKISELIGFNGSDKLPYLEKIFN